MRKYELEIKIFSNMTIFANEENLSAKYNKKVLKILFLQISFKFLRAENH